MTRDSLRDGVSAVSDTLLDLLFPLSCIGCGRGGRLVCHLCEPTLPALRLPFCPVCADPASRGLCGRCATSAVVFDGIRAPFRFEGLVRDLVYRLKYRGLRALASDAGRLMAGHLDAHPVPMDVLVPVPLHRKRLRERGYNQSELLARRVGRLTGTAVHTGLLRRKADTTPQVSIENIERRRSNIMGAFEARGDLEGLRVVLVDDVVTTGSTMTACATALKAAGARSVWGLALARQG